MSEQKAPEGCRQLGVGSLLPASRSGSSSRRHRLLTQGYDTTQVLGQIEIDRPCGIMRVTIK
eukprot:1150630-Pelagomonas_calceolata.AAC.2